MPRLVVLFVLALLAWTPHPAAAQLVVIDPANLVQTVLIAQRTLAQYEELRRQYQTLMRMGSGLGNLEGYRVPAISFGKHDADRFEFGKPWLQGLNSGDPAGRAFWATALPLARPDATLRALPEEARRTIERQYASVEIADSVAQMGGHQVALVRQYGARLDRAIQALESDVTNGLLRYHELTAVADKIAAGELIARRQDMAVNQLLSHVLEQLLAQSLSRRNSEVDALNMQLRTLAEASRPPLQSQAAGDALRSWRQP